MKLNDQIPGLPKWPIIEGKEDGSEFWVHGKQVSYGRYVFVRWVFRLLAYALMLFLGLGICMTVRPFVNGLVYLMFMFLFYVILFNIFNLPRLFCRLFFRKRTVVRFTRKHVIIGKRKYDSTVGVRIQFTANRPAVLYGYTPSGKRRYEPYALIFRRVEMIYGDRIIPVLTTDDAYRAEDFAIGLQIGQRLLRTHQASHVQKSLFKNITARDLLPE